MASLVRGFFIRTDESGRSQLRTEMSLCHRLGCERSGARFSKVPKCFLTRKAIAKSQTLWLKSCSMYLLLIWAEANFAQDVSGVNTSLSLIIRKWLAGPKGFEKRARRHMVMVTISEVKKNYFSMIAFSNWLTTIQESQPSFAEDRKKCLIFWNSKKGHIRLYMKFKQ